MSFCEIQYTHDFRKEVQCMKTNLMGARALPSLRRINPVLDAVDNLAGSVIAVRVRIIAPKA